MATRKNNKFLEGSNVAVQYLGHIYSDDGTRQYFMDSRTQASNALNHRTITTATGKLTLLPEDERMEEGIFSNDKIIIPEVALRLEKFVRRDIFKCELSGKNKINLTEKIMPNDIRLSFYSPRVSPDNKKIAFISVQNNKVVGIWVMNTDGSDAKMLYSFKRLNADMLFPGHTVKRSDHLKYGIRWSTDSRRVAFFEYSQEHKKGIFLSLAIEDPNSIEEVKEWNAFQEALLTWPKKYSKKEQISYRYDSPNNKFFITKYIRIRSRAGGLRPEKSYVLDILHRPIIGGYKRRVISEDVGFIQWTSDSRYFIFTYDSRIFLSDYKGNVINSFMADSPCILYKKTDE